MTEGEFARIPIEEGVIVIRTGRVGFAAGGPPFPEVFGATGRVIPFSASLMTDLINISSSRTRFFAPGPGAGAADFVLGRGNKF
jgi:hypothetical protein